MLNEVEQDETFFVGEVGCGPDAGGDSFTRWRGTRACLPLLAPSCDGGDFTYIYILEL